MRLTLDHSRHDRVPVGEAAEALRTYIELECLRLDHDIDVDFGVDADLPAAALVPPLLAQPYVENAFKHGLLHLRGRRRRLAVRFACGASAPDLLRVTVADNGVGRAAAAALRGRAAGREGFGMSATARRVALLDESEPGLAAVAVDDLYDADGAPAGTRVTLTIRYTYRAVATTAPASSTPSTPTHA